MISTCRNKNIDIEIFDWIFWNDYLPNDKWGMNANGDYVRKF
jgi:hypothetical protein